MLRTVTTADGKKTLAKSSGYDDGGKDKTEGGDATLGAAVTKYETQNLTIRKVLNGSLAKANEEFNFNVTINNTQQIVADMMSNTNTAGNGTESFSGNVQKYAAAVRGGDSITIRGIAKNADVNVVENQNDAKNYTTEITSNGEVKKDIKSKTAQLTMNGERELTYTNTSSMENVTPTGFARMVAPYMIIVALALFLAVVFLRGKQSV
jgi:cytochrome bd-type quinol oxidase subunit 1